MTVLALAFCAALAQPQTETADHLLSEWRQRLAAANAVTLVSGPTTGNAWDHETEIAFQRPTMSSFRCRSEWLVTDGKRITGGGMTNRLFAKKDVVRLRVAGFESFFEPQAKIAGVGNVEEMRWSSRQFLRIRYTVDARVQEVCFDPTTRMPAGVPQGAEVNPIYTQIVLGAQPRRELFRVLAPEPAAPIYREVAKRLRVAPELELTIYEDHTRYQYTEHREVGAFLPGLEAFFGNAGKPRLEKMAGIGQITNTDCYVLKARYAGHKGSSFWIYVDPDTFMPVGYQERAGGRIHQPKTYHLLHPS